MATRTETIKYSLVLIDKVMTTYPENVQIFKNDIQPMLNGIAYECGQLIETEKLEQLKSKVNPPEWYQDKAKQILNALYGIPGRISSPEDKEKGFLYAAELLKEMIPPPPVDPFLYSLSENRWDKGDFAVEVCPKDTGTWVNYGFDSLDDAMECFMYKRSSCQQGRMVQRGVVGAVLFTDKEG